jgi:hypothetical protein
MSASTERVNACYIEFSRSGRTGGRFGIRCGPLGSKFTAAYAVRVGSGCQNRPFWCPSQFPSGLLPPDPRDSQMDHLWLHTPDFASPFPPPLRRPHFAHADQLRHTSRPKKNSGGSLLSFSLGSFPLANMPGADRSSDVTLRGYGSTPPIVFMAAAREPGSTATGRWSLRRDPPCW